MKKLIALLLAVMMVLSLAACANTGDDNKGNNKGDNKGDAKNPTAVTLKVWTPAEDQNEDASKNWLTQMEKKFETAHPEYKITWINEVCGEDDAKAQVTKDPAAAADVYMYANDQLGELLAANAIAQLGGSYLEQVKNDNTEDMVNSVSADGKVYGFPNAANTWFCYYNKDVFSEEDVKSLNTMLEKGVVAFPTKNSWYIGAFFFANGASVFGPQGMDAAAGINLGDDKGVAALNALLEITAHKNYRTDDAGLGNSGMKSGEVDAYFSGAWEYGGLKEALGDKLGACQLPTVNIGGQAKQLKSFAGSKAVGVNSNSKNQKAAMDFAAYLASAEGQKLRYELRSAVPLAKSLTSEVQNDPVASAIVNTIANTSVLQPTLTEMGNWWSPMETLGQNIVAGTITAANAQKTMEDTVAQLNKSGL